MADHKINTSVRLTTEQVTAIRDEARRFGITDGEAHRRLLDAGIRALGTISLVRIEAVARQVG